MNGKRAKALRKAVALKLGKDNNSSAHKVQVYQTLKKSWNQSDDKKCEELLKILNSIK